MSRPWRHVAPLSLIALLACGPAAEEAADTPVWSLSAEPTLTIGEDGTVEGEFVRVATALSLPGNEVAVMDVGHAEIRVFDGTGRFQRTIGRKGEGPGEFAVINWAQMSNDTLMVYDLGQRRLTVLGTDGTLHATILPRPEGEEGFIMPLARAQGGQWVIRKSFSGSRFLEPSAPPPVGVVRDTLAIGLLDASGTGPVTFFHRAPAPPAIGLPGGIMTMSRFSVAISVMALGGRIAVVDPDLAMVNWFAPDGQPLASSNLALARRALSPALLDSLRNASMDRSTSPRDRALAEARHDPQAAPTHLPVFRVALGDGDDMLWLEEWQLAAPDSTRYLVVNGGGDLVAAVKMPPGFLPATIGPDWVLGVHRDADGVNRVLRYGLTRR